MADYSAYDSNLPCKNPNCKSHGRPHPNCRCYGMAKGGKVEPFCSTARMHSPGCEYYAEGGDVEAMPEPYQAAHPAVTLGHAAVTHGLLGILQKMGRQQLSNPDEGARVLHHAKEQQAYRQQPHDVPLAKSLGNRLGDAIVDRDHESAAKMLHGNPMVGSASKKNLGHIMGRLGPALLAQESDPNAVRNSADYLNSSLAGESSLNGEVTRMFDKQKKADRMEPNEDHRQAIKDQLEQFQENPQSMLDVGGNIGHYLPDHGAAVGALAATATNYLNSLKPTQSRMSPLDELTPPDPLATQKYDRQLDIAQKPLMVFQHVKDGTLQPQDLNTVRTLYPGLHQAMINKAGKMLIHAKSENKEIPYHQKQSMSMLLGIPLDSTMSPMGMQAIIQANGAAVAQDQAHKAKEKSNATAAQLEVIQKTDSLYETPLERREMNRRS